MGKLGVMAEGDFYYMRARYYDPVVGRFISEDPLGFDGGDVNLYVYGGNNPTLYVDPEGTFVFTGTMMLGVAAVKVGGLAIGYLGTRLAQHFTNTSAGGNMPDSAVNTAMAHTISASAYSAYGGVAAVSGIADAPAMARAAMNMARANPGAIEAITVAAEAVIGATVPGPPSSTSPSPYAAPAAYAGSGARWLYDQYNQATSRTVNPKP